MFLLVVLSVFRTVTTGLSVWDGNEYLTTGGFHSFGVRHVD